MKRLVLCSYYFPPIGGAGAQRPTKFARYLPEVGYRATVLTGPGGVTDRWAPADETLGRELPDDLEVHRVRGPEPVSGTWWSRAERWLPLKSPWERWWQRGVVAEAESFAEVEAIWTIMAPYTSAEPSLKLSCLLGRPWIADLGDPWALDEMMIYPSRVHLARERARMKRTLSTAAAIVMSTPEATRRVREFMPDFRGPIVAVGNGYDAADFGGPAPLVRNDGKLRIVHTGSLHTQLGLWQRKNATLRRVIGGPVAEVDILTRSHVYLLQAIDRLTSANPSLAERIEFHLAGVLSAADIEYARRSPVTRLHGYLDHAESVALLRSADLLFLPMQNLPPGRRAGLVPGKAYEYLASGQPILAAVPEGDARDLVAAAGASYVVAPDDVEGMKAALESALDGNLADKGRRDEGVVQEFEYRRLVRRVVDVVESVSGSR